MKIVKFSVALLIYSISAKPMSFARNFKPESIALVSTDTSIVGEQLGMLKRDKRWKEYAELRDRKIVEQPPQLGLNPLDANSVWALNSDAWEVFLNCQDPDVLKKALAWVELAIRLESPKPTPGMYVQFLDTRANLLYKLGQSNEAIAQEQAAIDTDNTDAKKEGRAAGFFAPEYQKILDKMKQGLPTWPTE